MNVTDRAICPPDHKHGQTPTCYRMHKCGCDGCRVANAQRCYQRKKLIAYGRPTSHLVPVEPARQRLRELSRAGWGSRALGATLGVDRSTVEAIIAQDSKRKQIRDDLAERILTLTLDDVRPTAWTLVDARGTVRRIQALGTLGWSEIEISRRIGMHRVSINRVAKNQRIRREFAQRIAVLYELRWDVPAETDPTVSPESVWITKGHARRAGYLPPMAWDDIDTDLWPPAVHHSPLLVDEIAVELALEGVNVRLSPQELLVAVKRGGQRDLSAAEIAERVGRTARTVVRKRTTNVRRAS